MTYWFLTSGNSQRDYSTFFEASTKCYPPWWNRLCVSHSFSCQPHSEKWSVVTQIKPIPFLIRNQWSVQCWYADNWRLCDDVMVGCPPPTITIHRTRYCAATLHSCLCSVHCSPLARRHNSVNNTDISCYTTARPRTPRLYCLDAE